MRRRKLVITLAAAAAFGTVVVPASAELHRVTVTLITGQQITMTVDVPEGASVQSIEIPGLPAPVQSITDLGPVATPTPVPEPTAAPTVPETPVTPAPDEDDPANEQGGSGGGKGGKGVDEGDAPTSPNQVAGSKGGKRKQRVGDDQAALPPNSEALTGKLEKAKQKDSKRVDRSNPTRHTDGSPTLDNPTVSLATPGPARIGV